RAPDSTDRFGFGGDPNLDPETSLNLELGLNHRFNAHHALSLSAFDNRIEDLIEYNTASSRMENIGKARIYGLEGAYNFDLGRWHLRVTAIAQNPENDKTNEQLLRRAKHTMTASLTYQQKLYSVLVDFLATGKRKDVTEDLDAYQLVNATLQLRPYGGWLAQLKVENLLDENYELAKSYNTPERSFYFELAYNYR
ncbi:MAG TPA: TonB-dependent receptor, partial [Gammaproteobacteria bacterium]|nr:TonB-dependent receptor [Gammaproteobacteria bacterium]